MAKIERTSARIKIAMQAKGIKASELARLTGISKSTISCYLTERRHPTDENIERIARVLMVDEAWLLGYGGEGEISPAKKLLSEMVLKMNETQVEKTVKFIKDYIL